MGRTKNRKPVVPVKSKLKKDPGIPKLPDLKARVRNHAKGYESQVPLERRLDPDTPMASEPTLSTLAMLAAEASSIAVPEDQDPSSSTSMRERTREQVRRYYLKALHKVIDQSDIILLVLDARDPEGCRSRLVEEEVRRRESEGKKLLFVLNKIDLVPKANAQAWLKYLRHSTPTLPFLAPASQNNRSVSSSTAPALMKLLKAYKPKARSMTVGVVGYPNVGKSSIINCIKRSKVCSVAATPGHTKELQSIQIERGLKVIDSPGVVFDDDEYGDHKGNKKGSVLLRNVVRVEDVEDPIEVVDDILARTPRESIQKIYNLPEFGSSLEFLTMLALTTGRLHKGGTPDLNSAARQVLNDWNQQKIPYFSQPPELHPSLVPTTLQVGNAASAPVVARGAEQVGQAQILTSYSKPFELDGLFDAVDAGAFRTGARDVQMDGEAEEMQFDAMEEDGNEMFSDGLMPNIPRKRTRSPSPQNGSMEAASTFIPGGDVLSQYTRQPKRQRRNKVIPEYDAKPDKNVLERMGTSNPLNRKTLKKDAKRARKQMNLRARTEAASGMKIDQDALEFTFMA